MTGSSQIPPAMGLGTWGRTGPDGLAAIERALELGYRHFDTAQTYGTERNVGEALRRSGLGRDAFFVTTKVADTNLAASDLLSSLRKSLEAIGVDQVDLTLIHWPSPGDQVPFEEYMDALAEARVLGLTRFIGVSNYPCALLERAVSRLGAHAIATNQVELHPFLQNRQVRAACARHGVRVTAYMPLAGGLVLQDPVLQRTGAAHGVPATAVALAWLLQRDMAVIPASSRVEHLADNLRALSIRLSDAELGAIDALDRGQRLVDPPKSPAWD